MNGTEPILSAAFFRTASGNEPVREWIKSLPRGERRIIGEDIKPCNSVGRSECRSFVNSTRACGKFVPACLTASYELSSPVPKVG